MKNITFSADEIKIELAREVARSEHKTLNDAFRDAGRKFTRDEMNER
jgi:hypothetical protein